MDEGLGVILRLLNDDEPFSFKGSFFELHDAALQIRPLQDQIPVACASTISPSGMKCRRKVWRRGAFDSLLLGRRIAGAADPVAFRRDLREGVRPYHRSQANGAS